MVSDLAEMAGFVKFAASVDDNSCSRTFERLAGEASGATQPDGIERLPWTIGVDVRRPGASRFSD